MFMRVTLDEGAFMPERAYDTDAGLDLKTPIDFVVPAHGFAFVDTGVHVELPMGTRGHICSKSGLNRYHGLFTDGTIDISYRGSIGVTIHNDSDEDYHFVRGNKVAQLVVEKIMLVRPTLVKTLAAGERGDSGYGSTGA